MNADGTELKELFAVEDSLQESITTEPAWSPDSQRIAFVHQTQPNEGKQGMVKLYTVRADGAELEDIVDPEQRFPGLGHSGVISWSPDGEKLLLSSTEYPGLVSVATVKVDGTDWREIGEDGRHAIWSPDGSRIAQLGSIDDRVQLSMINRDGTDLQVLVRIDEEGNLAAAHPPKPEPKKCFLGICW